MIEDALWNVWVNSWVKIQCSEWSSEQEKCNRCTVFSLYLFIYLFFTSDPCPDFKKFYLTVVYSLKASASKKCCFKCQRIPLRPCRDIINHYWGCDWCATEPVVNSFLREHSLCQSWWAPLLKGFKRGNCCYLWVKSLDVCNCQPSAGPVPALIY